MKLQRIDEFEDFLAHEVASAAEELERLKKEESRKHLQRLVYTNLVDRFDFTVDHVLLENALSEPLLTEALAKLTDTLPEGKILGLLADLPKAAIYVENRVKETLRNGVLRSRHSKKLERLLALLCPAENVRIPRVNVSTGDITPSFKPQNSKMPSSLLGYADWLYSRRNAIIHGGGSALMLRNDVQQLKALSNCNVARTVKLKLASIQNASRFYRGLATLMRNASGAAEPR